MDALFLQIRNALAARYDGREAHALALLVLEDAFGVGRTDVYADKVRKFSEEETLRLRNILQRLAAAEPVQYVLGRARFDGMELEVTPATLIPRPETEELVEWIASENAGRALRLLDGGTGSGCIAIGLSRRLPLAEVEAWDISEEALAVARRNARAQGADVRFLRRDLLEAAPAGLVFDVIASNPPYVCEREKAGMEPQVLLHEPHGALFVPDEDPLRFYRAIAALGRQCLAPGGSVYVEINQAYGKETAAAFRETGYGEVTVRKDQFGNDRMLKAAGAS